MTALWELSPASLLKWTPQKITPAAAEVSESSFIVLVYVPISLLQSIYVFSTHLYHIALSFSPTDIEKPTDDVSTLIFHLSFMILAGAMKANSDTNFKGSIVKCSHWAIWLAQCQQDWGLGSLSLAETSEWVKDVGACMLEHMPRTACIMAAIIAINNCNSHVDVYASLPGMRNEPPEKVDDPTHTHTHLFFFQTYTTTHTLFQHQIYSFVWVCFCVSSLLKFSPHDSVMHFNV